MNPAGFDQYQLPRVVFQAVVVVVSAALMLASGLPLARPLVALSVFLLILAVAAAAAPAPLVAFAGTDARRFGLLGWLLVAGGFVVGTRFQSSTDRRCLLTVIVTASLPIASYALLQRLGVDPFSLVGAGRQLRPVSTVGNAAFLGAFLAVAVVAAFGLAVGSLASWWWAIPVIAIDTAALITTASRGAWIGATIGVLVLSWSARRLGMIRRLVPVACSFLVAVAITSLAVSGVGARATSVARFTEGTAGGRIELAQMGVNAVIERPLLGWGPDMSRPALHSQIDVDFEARYGDARIEDRVHNTVIDVAVWSGLIGVVGFIWFVASTVRSARRRRHDWTQVVVGAAVGSYAVHLLFNFPTPDVDVAVWVLAGSLVTVSRRGAPLPTYLIYPVVGLLFMFGGPSAIDSLVADRHLRLGVDRENAGDAGAAATQYQLAMSTSSSALYGEVLARFYLRFDRPADAVLAAQAARRHDGSDPYLAELQMKAMVATALENGDVTLAAAAERVLRSLVAASPNDGSLHIELGTALAAQADLEGAEAQYLMAAELLPARSEPLRNLGLLAERRGELTIAIEYLQKALAVNRDDATARAALDRLEDGS